MRMAATAAAWSVRVIRGALEAGWSGRPVLVAWPVEAVADERPDRDACNLERVVLEVDSDGLMVGVRGLGVELDAPLVQAHVALEGHLVFEAGHDDFTVRGDWLGLDRDYRAGDEPEAVHGPPLHPEEEIRGAGEPSRHRPGDPGRHTLVGEEWLAGGDGPGHGEREIVLEEPDEARATRPEFNPALAV